ncbi:kinase-like domain-containing protein, partial [Mycena filopes]
MVLIYRDVLVLLKATPSPRLGSASESTEYHAVVDGYMTSMSSDNIATAVVQSLSCRRTLLELSAKLGVKDDDGLRVALHTGDERIAELLQSIFKSGKAEATMLKLKGDAAQDFLDVVQATLDRGLLVAEDDIRRARRMILKLSESSEKLPSGVFITGVTRRGPDPTFGGGYCDVYLGSHGDQMVAVKHIRQFLRGAELRRLRKRFYREALLWKDLRHPNILSFLGIDRASFPSSLCMVSPWMENGTVLKYLKEHGRARIGELLYHIARGLRYLHAHNIIHGDLRGTNILITADWKACLADFGLSTLSDITASTTTTCRGSSYWMAPELLDPDSFGLKFARTRATDVYAFGCVCVERVVRVVRGDYVREQWE